jgi:hypothetical protein
MHAAREDLNARPYGGGKSISPLGGSPNDTAIRNATFLDGKEVSVISNFS